MKFRIYHITHKALSFLVALWLLIFFNLIYPHEIGANTRYWDIESIDTMKYSRDMARDWRGDKVFNKIIESVVQKIAESGATHVAVGTPYDEEFSDYLLEWVAAARENDLNVWFRGNFSGWEGWFDYPEISKEEHLKNVGSFILENPSIFEDGDIFTPCSECENGLIGDPRQTGNVDGYREFLIDEYEASLDAFAKIGKNVKTGYFSMNADVARIVMDEVTTKRLGGFVVIDHYVKDPKELARDVKEISIKSGGKVILGEFGVPIPDINGDMSEDEQADWIENALGYLAKEPDLFGVNYWVSFGGSTAIWNNDGSARKGALVLKEYFSPRVLSGRVVNEIGKPIKDTLVIADSKQISADEEGRFEIALNPSSTEVKFDADDYKIKTAKVDESNGMVTLEKEKENIFFKIGKFFYKVYTKFRYINLFS